MNEQTIICPDCGKEIPLSKALSEQLTHQLQQERRKQETQLAQAREQIEKEKQKLELVVAEKVAAEKKKLWAVAVQKAEEKQAKELLDLQQQLKATATQLEKSEKLELELRQKARTLEDREKKLELEMARALDEERQKIIEETKKQEAEQQRLKLQEKDKQLEIMRKQIDDLKRKAEQGSMQIQGEVQENDLRMVLTTTFFADDIQDVPTGSTGADILQLVNAKIGTPTGTIIWESKNTKAFSESWITKLKSDQGLVKADSAILVTQVLPPDVQGFGLKNGVWLCDYQHYIPLVSALRLHLIELAKIKTSLVGRDEKMEVLYRYLSGSQFRNRVENIVMAFMNMKQDLETEKRSLQRSWAKREKELERVITSTSSLYGDLQGIIGGSLPTIQQLELPDPEMPI